MYIISRCLLGFDCRYDGGDNRIEDIVEFCKTHDYVAVCPETAGGLASPRPPAEIVRGDNGEISVITREGKDVTGDFICGAGLSVSSILLEAHSRKGHGCTIEGAILKARSPSCGSGKVYDGTFTGTLTDGNGILTDRLIEACLEERENPYLSEENRVFSRDFRICDENNYRKVFGDKQKW